MAYDINAALERLEKNLSEVESAKKQVEETIATSESLQQIIGRYSDSLVELNKEITKFIAEVHNYQSLKTSELDTAIKKIMTSCEAVISKFNVDVKSSTDAFNAKFSEAITKFGSENNNLAEQVTKLSSLHGTLKDATSEIKEIERKLDEIAKNLKDSQAEQDRTLDNIKSSLSNSKLIVTLFFKKEIKMKSKSILSKRVICVMGVIVGIAIIIVITIIPVLSISLRIVQITTIAFCWFDRNTFVGITRINLFENLQYIRILNNIHVYRNSNCFFYYSA